jgi:hypothetical protein
MATESILSSVRRPSPAANRAAAAVRDLEADRVIGIVGALTVVVATGLSWYSERVSLRVSGALEASSISVTLWHLRTVAAALLVAGAASGLILLTGGAAASRES